MKQNNVNPWLCANISLLMSGLVLIVAIIPFLITFGIDIYYWGVTGDSAWYSWTELKSSGQWFAFFVNLVALLLNGFTAYLYRYNRQSLLYYYA